MGKIKLKSWNPSDKLNQKGDFTIPVSVIVKIIIKLVEQYDVLTVRQVHYKLVETPKAEHPNTKPAYARVSRILTDMRQAGLLDWDKIIDETRGVYKTTSYEDIDEAEEILLANYRRDRWKDNENYIEVWTEKRTLINQFNKITDKYDVRLASGGGFSSTTYVYGAIKRLIPKAREGKRITIIYFGDLDPSGDYMHKDIEKRFADWGVPLKIQRVALNYEQLEEYNLKKKFDVKAKKGDKIYNKIQADPRAKGMYEKYGEVFQVELEALDPKVLNEMLENSILEYVNLKEQEEVKLVEQKEVEDIKQKLGYD